MLGREYTYQPTHRLLGYTRKRLLRLSFRGGEVVKMEAGQYLGNETCFSYAFASLRPILPVQLPSS